MKILAIISQVFLLIVGIIYAALGLISLVSGSGILFGLGIFIQPPMFMYTKALCDFVMFCGEDLNHLMPIIFAGIIGIFGIIGAVKIMRSKETGYKIWKFLIIVLGATLLFNFAADISDIFDRFPTDDFIIIHIFNLAWLILILVDYLFLLKFLYKTKVRA